MLEWRLEGEYPRKILTGSCRRGMFSEQDYTHLRIIYRWIEQGGRFCRKRWRDSSERLLI